MRFVLLLFFAALSCHASKSVHQFTLDNGLKVVVKEDHRAPVAVTMIWYNVGSADEPAGITGVSHALEHLMFKGTAHYPVGTFSKTIAALGGQENAATNQDYTYYYEKIAATQLPTAFELEADRMQNLLLNEHEFKQEIKVIREERRMRVEDNPQALTFERYLAAAHLTEPYHHPVIGWMNDLRQMNINDLRAWYQNFYAPNNATLVVVGDVKTAQVFELAKFHFGKLTRRPDYIRKKQIEPRGLGPKSISIHAPAKVPLLMFGYTVPSVSTATKDWEPYALELLTGILNAGESSRLAKNLVRGHHLASSTAVYYNLYTRYPTQFIFYGTPAQNYSIADLKNGLLREIQQLQNLLVNNHELTRVKTQIIAQKTFEKDSIFAQASEIGLLETLGLGWQTTQVYSDQINRITPQQVQDVAKRYFTESTFTEAQLLPLLPSKDQP